MTAIKKPKFDIKAIVDNVQKLYAKDEKSKSMVQSGSTIRKAYSIDDGIPVPATHPLSELVGLPCVPFNKIVQFSGQPDSGKSTSAGEIMAEAQKAGHLVILWDAEDKFDANRFNTQFGGQSDDVVLIKTNEILQGGEKVRKTIIEVKELYPTAKVLFVWDSVGGSQSRSHAERELDSEKHGQPGQDAKENGQVMKMLVALINTYPDSIATILVNQVYAKIGFMQHGNAESGGKKIEFHSSLIIQFNRMKVLTKIVKGRKVKYGILTKASVKKNHLSQSATSLHELPFEITAKGATVSNEEIIDDEGEES